MPYSLQQIQDQWRSGAKSSFQEQPKTKSRSLASSSITSTAVQEKFYRWPLATQKRRRVVLAAARPINAPVVSCTVIAALALAPTPSSPCLAGTACLPGAPRSQFLGAALLHRGISSVSVGRMPLRPSFAVSPPNSNTHAMQQGFYCTTWVCALPPVRPNRSLNRTHCGVPPFGLENPSPNAATPQRSG